MTRVRVRRVPLVFRCAGALLLLADRYGRKSFDDPDRRTSSVEDQRLAAASYAERHGFERRQRHHRCDHGTPRPARAARRHYPR